MKEKKMITRQATNDQSAKVGTIEIDPARTGVELLEQKNNKARSFET